VPNRKHRTSLTAETEHTSPVQSAPATVMAERIMFTKDQLAERWQVSEYTVMRWYRKGALRGVALSDHTVRFPASAVYAFERDGVPKDDAAKRRR
jgi:hypothetical protein